MKIRKASVADIEQITRLYVNTITTVNIKHYTLKQVSVWAARANNKPGWIDKINNQYFLVSEIGTTISGFSSITHTGHIDLLFVHHNYQGQGIARKLIGELEQFATEQHITLLTTDASITARPVFERFGFGIVTEQTVSVDGVELTNYKMNKYLSA